MRHGPSVPLLPRGRWASTHCAQARRLLKSDHQLDASRVGCQFVSFLGGHPSHRETPVSHPLRLIRIAPPAPGRTTLSLQALQGA